MQTTTYSLAVLAALTAALGGCGADSAAADAADAAADADTSAPADGDTAGAEACTGLFGRPNARTGLDESSCSPTCACGAGAWTPTPWDEARVAALRQWTLLAPPAILEADPYDQPAPEVPDGSVCAVVVVDPSARTYRVETFASAALATAAGAIVSHGGVCGLCSSLADLAVYAGEGDLTQPVRACGLQHFDHEGDAACLRDLGFTAPCAEIWAYNTTHTREACGATCIELLTAPYNTPDGGLNACLACDEAESGPVFKALAGRTRRNTGVPSAICRPCAGVLHLDHVY